MPPVIIAVAAVAADAAVTAAVTAAVGSALAASIAGGIAGILVSAVGTMLIGGQKQSGSTNIAGQTQTLKSPTAARRVIYGRTRVGGITVFETSLSAAAYELERLLIVICWAGHECDAIEQFFGNDAPIPIVANTDPNHPNTQGPGYADPSNPGANPYGASNNEGAMYFSSHLGAPGQVADQDLINWNVGWTADMVLNGVCYTFFHLFYWQQYYPTGIPNLTALIRGRKCYDPRTGTTAWTQNPALCIRDYLTATDPVGNPVGIGCLDAEIDDDSFIAAANICDETVTLADGTVATFADSTTATISMNTPFTFQAAAVVTYNGAQVTLTYRTSATVVDGLTASLSGGETAVTFADGSTGSLPFGTQVMLDTATVITFSDGINATLSSAAGTTEPMFTMNGSFTVDQTPIQIMEDMLTACAGRLVYEAGKYRLKVAAYTAPTMQIDETFLRGAVTMTDGPTRQSLFNTVRGVYVDPTSFYQPTDFLPVENAAFRTADGGYEIPTDIQLPYTQSPTMANRLATLVLNRSRLKTLTLECNYKALQCRVMDNIQLSIAVLGWSNKEFLITGWRWVDTGGIDLQLEEEDASTYEVGPGQMLIPPSGTSLASPLFIAAPTDVVAAVSSHVQADGSSVPTLTITWVASTGPFVASYVINWKAVGDTNWNVATAPNTAVAFTVSPVKDGVQYVAQVQALNTLGVPSAFASSSNSSTATVDQTPPPAPGNLTVTPGYRQFALAWTMPSSSAYNPAQIRTAQIYYVEGSAVGQTPGQAGATLLTEVSSTSYVNANVGLAEGRTFWVVFVSVAGVIGTYTSGVYAATPATFPIADLGTAVITDSMLAPALATPIALITAPSSTVGSIAAALAAATSASTAATAASAEALAAAQFSTSAVSDLNIALQAATSGILALSPLLSNLSTAFNNAGFVYDPTTGNLIYNALAEVQAQNQTTYTTVLAELSAANASILLKADASTVQNQIAALLAGNQPYQADYFQGSADSWTASGATLTANAASITFTATGTTPLLSKSSLTIPGNTYNQVVVVLRRLDSNTDWSGVLQYSTSGHGYSSSYQQAVAQPTSFGSFQTLVWDMSQIADWAASTITGLQFALSTTSGDSFEIQSIQVTKNTVQQLLLSGLQAQINSASVAISGLQASVALAASATSVAANTAQINSLQVSVNALTSEIALAATTTALNALQTQVNNAQILIDSLQSSITENVNSVTVPGAEDAAAALLAQMVNDANAGQSINGSLAQAVQQLTAFTQNQVSAEASARLDLTTVVNANTAALSQEALVRASADDALSELLATLTATVNANSTSISASLSTEASTRASADTSLSQQLAALTATVTGNNSSSIASLATEASTRASADTALSNLIATLSSTVDANNSASTSNLAIEASTRAAADSANATAVANLSASVASSVSTLTSEITTVANSASSTATSLTNLIAGYSGNLAGLSASLTVTADQSTANASSLTTLSSTVGTLSSAVSTNATAISGIQAQWTVQVETLSNGKTAIAGLGVIAGTDNQTEIDLIASKVVIADYDPSTGSLATISPFFVSGGQVYIQNEMVGSLAANKITSGTITAQDITIEGSLTVVSSTGQTLFGIGGFGTGVIGTANLGTNSVTDLGSAYTASVVNIPNDGAWHTVQTLSFTVPSTATGSTGASIAFTVYGSDPGVDAGGGNNDAGGGSGG